MPQLPATSSRMLFGPLPMLAQLTCTTKVLYMSTAPTSLAGQTEQDTMRSVSISLQKRRHAPPTCVFAPGEVLTRRRARRGCPMVWRSHSQNVVQTLKQTSSREYPKNAACVQDPIDSLNSAIRNAHRTSLRPSSTFEPRHPSLKGVIGIENSEGRGPRERQRGQM